MAALKEFILLLGTFFLLMPATLAQSAYHGGKGDGYGSATTEQQQPSGQNNTRIRSKLAIYPQPVQLGMAATVHLPRPVEDAAHYELFNSMGQLVAQGRVQTKDQQFKLTFANQRTAGTYLLRVTAGEVHWQQQVVLLK